jgi:hypothetical protein
MRINQPEYTVTKIDSDGYLHRDAHRLNFRGIDVLLIGQFESESITLDQLRGIFGRYKVVILSEVEEKLQSYK